MVVKLTLHDAQKIASERGGVCLSEEYINNVTLMLWKCKCNHIWKARFANVKNSNTWCPECNNEKKRNGIIKAQKLAENKNGKCLSTEYKEAHSKLKWECSRKHT